MGVSKTPDTLTMPITDAKVRNSKPADKTYKVSDSGGLYLLVKPNGSKLWRWKYRIASKENHFAIGEYPIVGLGAARTARDESRKLVKQGIHPAHHRQAQKVAQFDENTNTFQAVAREWIETKKPRWTAYYLRQVERCLAADVYPYLGSLPIRTVTAAHLLAIIRRVEKRGAVVVAINLRQWLSAIFRHAVVTQRADSDPAAALKGAIHRPKVQHIQPLSRKDIPDFFKALDNYGGHRATVIAIHLLMLTAVRTIELRGAEWIEFDLEVAEWRVPAERMKMKEPHAVPLSAQAIELLQELHTLTGNHRYLFPNARQPSRYIAATTLNRALEYMGYKDKLSAHGFRSTFSTILNELGHRADVIERQLAHTERNQIRAAYNRAEYLPERRRMMQAYTDYLDTLKNGAKVVVPLHRGKHT